MTTEQRAEEMREAVREAWETAPDVTTGVLRALVEVGSVTWGMVHNANATVLFCSGSCKIERIDPVLDFLRALLTAAGVPTTEENER